MTAARPVSQPWSSVLSSFSPSSVSTLRVLTVRVKAGCSLGGSLWPAGFRLRRLAQEFLCPISMFILTAEARTNFAARKCFAGVVLLSGAWNLHIWINLEVWNVSLRGRRKGRTRVRNRSGLVAVAKGLAGVCHSKDCVLPDRRSESAPVEWFDSLHFGNLNLRMILRGQRSILYDLGSRFCGRRSASETCSRTVSCLRR